MRNRKQRKFDWYKTKQRYALRKFHCGLASILLGVVLPISMIDSSNHVEASIDNEHLEHVEKVQPELEMNTGKKRTDTSIGEMNQNITVDQVNMTVNEVEFRMNTANIARAVMRTDSLNEEAILDLEQAVKDKKAQVKNVTPTSSDKQSAKDILDQEAKEKKDMIDKRTDLTVEERSDAKDGLNDQVNQYKRKIDEATTDADVEMIKRHAVEEIKRRNPYAFYKRSSESRIDEAGEKKLDSIESRTDLTVEEKNMAIAQLAQMVKAAIQEVNEAMTNDSVVQARRKGIQKIEDFNPRAEVKQTAIKIVDETAKERLDMIGHRIDLTVEEKMAIQDQINVQANQTKKAINEATTNATVADAQRVGIAAILKIDTSSNNKNRARVAVSDVAKEIIMAIESRTDLTDEEKEMIKTQIKAIVKTAEDNIDNAMRDAEVEQARENAINEMSRFNIGGFKSKAKTEIEQVANDKKMQIEASNDLTEEEKQVAKEQVDAKVKIASKAIDDAKTNEAVVTAKTDGVTEISNFVPIATVKTEAKTEIEQNATVKKAEIDKRNDLTEEEKQMAMEQINVKVKVTIDTIMSAKTNQDVYTIKVHGINDISTFSPSALAKTGAKKIIDNVVKNKQDDIDARKDLTEEEQQMAKVQIIRKAEVAKAEIDSVNTEAEVNKAKDNGVDAIGQVNTMAMVKPTAKGMIEQTTITKKNKIADRTDLTNEEKETANVHVEQIAQATQNAIDTALTHAEVETAKINGIYAIDSFNPQARVKLEVIAIIEQVVTVKKAEIEARADLTTQEKEMAKAQVDQIMQVAQSAIDNASNNADINTAKMNGIYAIDTFNPQARVKLEVIAIIEQVATVKKAEIEARVDLTTEEKGVAKAQVEQIMQLAQNAIDIASTHAEVEIAKINGIYAIDTFNPQARVEAKAKVTIQQVTNAKKVELNTRKDLTAQEKDMENKLLPYTGDNNSLLSAVLGSILIPFGLTLLSRKKDND